jgi:hypothetical protein
MKGSRFLKAVYIKDAMTFYPEYWQRLQLFPFFFLSFALSSSSSFFLLFSFIAWHILYHCDHDNYNGDRKGFGNITACVGQLIESYNVRDELNRNKVYPNTSSPSYIYI